MEKRTLRKFDGPKSQMGSDHADNQDTGRLAPRTTASEGDYNRWFCALVNGETETRHGHMSAGGRSYVQVDCETGMMVYEGGL